MADVRQLRHALPDRVRRGVPEAKAKPAAAIGVVRRPFDAWIDRDAFRASLERMLDWPFERVIVAHGAVSERGGREELVRNYAWLLG